MLPRLLCCSLLLTALAACSSAAPSASQSAPADATLGSAPWYAWVDQQLDVDSALGNGSPAWDQAVAQKLGQEAPDDPPGSPQWQQAVDALLRTRASHR